MNHNTINIKCSNTGEIHTIAPGLSLSEIALKLNIKLKNKILGAHVNNKTLGLGYQVFQPKTIDFFDISHPDGMRMYIRSLIFLLYKAVDELHPGLRLKVSHSVSKGIYCELIGRDEPLTNE